jgi:cytochrome c-type biogenesis protein CcmH/NrfG
LKATRALDRAVQIDGNFVLAHARLADAWNELDFTRKGQEEMLRASGLDTGRQPPKIDREYLHAVNATLTGQFAAAVQDYAAILRELPAGEKAYGYVDLGRANEKAGNVSEAQKNFAQAAKLAPENPAPFMRLGILESREAGRSGEGEAAFAHAEALYRAANRLPERHCRAFAARRSPGADVPGRIAARGARYRQPAVTDPGANPDERG